MRWILRTHTTTRSTRPRTSSSRRRQAGRDRQHLPEREPATDDEAPEQPAKPSSTPPANGWAQRLSTPAAGWVATADATLVAALIRLPGLGNVRTLIFDETYYVKDAWSHLALGYEGTSAKDVDTAFANGDTSGLSAVGGYPVHPPTGKWLIATGMKFFGQADPVGWRIAAAICGVITVFLLCRLAQNLFRSPRHHPPRRPVPGDGRHGDCHEPHIHPRRIPRDVCAGRIPVRREGSAHGTARTHRQAGDLGMDWASRGRGGTPLGRT